MSLLGPDTAHCLFPDALGVADKVVVIIRYEGP
jgi:hypothetical protein